METVRPVGSAKSAIGKMTTYGPLLTDSGLTGATEAETDDSGDSGEPAEDA